MHASMGTQRHSDPAGVANLGADTTTWPLLICVLGTFHVMRAGAPVSLQMGKAAALLGHLALRYEQGISRSILLDALWPGSDAALAGEALYSRIHSLGKLLGPALGGAPLVVHAGDSYRLNSQAGVSVDVACFEALAMGGDRQARAGHVAASAALYERAVQFYRGDLCVQTGLYAVVERERLRARYLTILSALGTYTYDVGDSAASLAYAQRVLSHDPCREDAHRLVMRCHIRQGERAQALHQYRVCEAILRAAFQTMPEPETVALFEQMRCDPASV